MNTETAIGKDELKAIAEARIAEWKKNPSNGANALKLRMVDFLTQIDGLIKVFATDVAREIRYVEKKYRIDDSFAVIDNLWKRYSIFEKAPSAREDATEREVGVPDQSACVDAARAKQEAQEENRPADANVDDPDPCYTLDVMRDEIWEQLSEYRGKENQPRTVHLGNRQMAVLRREKPAMFDEDGELNSYVTFQGLEVNEDSDDDCVLVR